jgi:hypothetical protein
MYQTPHNRCSGIDIVYFTTPVSFYQHRELRYSLRSLARHVDGVRRVFILGHPPAWLLSPAVHLPEADPYTHNKDANIIHKMHRACREPQISDPFLFVNDDHYFTQDCRAESFPYYHKGELRPSRGDYGRRLLNTRKLLLEWGLSTLNFDVHTPILIHKAQFLAAFAACYWVDLFGPGVVMKSVYGNFNPELVARAVYLPDCKMTLKAAGNVENWLQQLRLRPCWSSGEHVTQLVWQLLLRLYPEPSKFESGKL